MRSLQDCRTDHSIISPNNIEFAGKENLQMDLNIAKKEKMKTEDENKMLKVSILLLSLSY